MQHYFVNKVNNTFALTPGDVHHILHVMRAKSGDKVVFCHGGKQYEVELTISAEALTWKVVRELDIKRELDIEETLIVGLPRLEKFELVIQKATELGVTKIVPFLSSRSIIKLDPKKIGPKVERWNLIAKEAAEQSRRCVCPIVTNPIKEKDLVKYLSNTNILAYENSAEDEFVNLVKDAKGSITLLLGPEGGFSTEEVEHFEKLGFRQVSLGNRILRCETAAIFMASIVEVYHN